METMTVEICPMKIQPNVVSLRLLDYYYCYNYGFNDLTDVCRTSMQRHQMEVNF